MIMLGNAYADRRYFAVWAEGGAGVGSAHATATPSTLRGQYNGKELTGTGVLRGSHDRAHLVALYRAGHANAERIHGELQWPTTGQMPNETYSPGGPRPVQSDGLVGRRQHRHAARQPWQSAARHLCKSHFSRHTMGRSA